MTTTHSAQTPGEDRAVAVIGLGAMGGAMAASLHGTGWTVRGFDPSPDARRAAEENGIETVTELSAVAGTPYVLLSLPSARIVEQTVPTLLEADGTTAIVDTSTSEPATSRTLAAQAAERGIAFVDAPVSGGRAGAAAGSLPAFVGGTGAAVEAATPLLQALTGGASEHIGDPGSGNVVKLLNNALAAAHLVAAGEALEVAVAHGVDPAIAAASIGRASGASRALSAMYPDWVLSGTYDSGFALGLMARDAALACDIASSAERGPALLEHASDQWQEALERLGPSADFTEIARVVAPSLTDPAPRDTETDL